MALWTPLILVTSSNHWLLFLPRSTLTNYRHAITSTALPLFAKYTSLQSPNSRLSYIQARWCGDEGNIDSSGDSCRPGQIMYFLHMFVPVKESQECLPLVFAYIRWYQKHDGRDIYESPSVSVWAKNVFEPDGPASFIPIQRIKGRIITGLVTWRGEVVRVTIPQISINYW